MKSNSEWTTEGGDRGSPERRRIARGAVAFDVWINDAGEDRFWRKFESGRWERETLAALAEFLDAETMFVDIGGWIGPTSLYAAALGSRVCCVEADPEALRRLRANLELNPGLSARIQVVDRALYPRPGQVRLASHRKPGDSMSSIVHDKAAAVWSVATITPDELAEKIAGAPRYFVKIDIEGGEYANVPRAAALARLPLAALHLSFHPEFALGASRGARRLARLIRLSFDTAAIFRVLGAMRATRLAKRGSVRSPAVDALGRFGLFLWPVAGSWIFVPKR